MSITGMSEGREVLCVEMGGPYWQGVGKITDKGGEIFNDYENNTATGEYSHAQNHQTHAKAKGSSTSGRGTIAGGEYQNVRGMYNVEDTEGKFADVVGGGTSESNRVNIHTLDWEGNAWFAGNVYAGNKKLVGLNEIGGYPIIESTEYPGCCYRLVNGVIEWLNPPLIPGMGEFRTVQRYGSYPVYVKTLNFGYLPNKTSGSVSVGIPASDVIRMDGCAFKSDGSLKYPLPMPSSEKMHVYMLINAKGSLVFRTMADYSTWTAEVTLWYIKREEVA